MHTVYKAQIKCIEYQDAWAGMGDDGCETAYAHGVPTIAYKIFDDPKPAWEWIETYKWQRSQYDVDCFKPVHEYVTEHKVRSSQYHSLTSKRHKKDRDYWTYDVRTIDWKM